MDSEHLPAAAPDGPAPASRRFNILHTSRSLRVDGVVKVVLRNVSHLGRERFRHYVGSLLAEDDLVDEFRQNGAEPVFLGHNSAISTPATILRTSRLLRRLGIDLVHVHRTIDLAIVGAAAKLNGLPVVSTLHWMGPEPYPPEVSRWRKESAALVRIALDRAFADRVIAVSHAVVASFARLPGFPAERVEVVYPGLDTRAGAAPTGDTIGRLRTELGLDRAEPVLLNVGRLVPIKGQIHLLPMMRRIREQIPAARLLIAGGGELRDELAQAVAAAGLQDAITFLGSRSDVDALLGLADLLVVSSESEAAPLPPMEAMRMGVPVVATRAGGLDEIVEDGVTGYVVRTGDPAALADAVVRVLVTPGLAAEMGAAGRRVARERFDISISVRSLEQIYCSLLGRTAVAGQPAAARRTARS